jgi:predicted N-formylglutamate amidohydrolase
MPEGLAIVVTCEHGGNRVPAPYLQLFAGQEELLASHRGCDLGILPFARRLARELDAPLFASTVSRLLVDLNRSAASPTLFSEFTRSLPAPEREAILRRYYHPYRSGVAAAVAEGVCPGRRVLHLSAHSFTPVWQGSERRADVGLLYDPGRAAEAGFCRLWQQAIGRFDPSLRVRRNYPYRGVADSLVTTLRRRFLADRYLGVEIEINQSYPTGERKPWARLQSTLLAALRSLLF